MAIRLSCISFICCAPYKHKSAIPSPTSTTSTRPSCLGVRLLSPFCLRPPLSAALLASHIVITCCYSTQLFPSAEMTLIPPGAHLCKLNPSVMYLPANPSQPQSTCLLRRLLPTLVNRRLSPCPAALALVRLNALVPPSLPVMHHQLECIRLTGHLPLSTPLRCCSHFHAVQVPPLRVRLPRFPSSPLSATISQDRHRLLLSILPVPLFLKGI